MFSTGMVQYPMTLGVHAAAAVHCANNCDKPPINKAAKSKVFFHMMYFKSLSILSKIKLQIHTNEQSKSLIIYKQAFYK